MNAHLTSSTKFQKRLDYVGQHALSASLCLMHDVMSLLTRFFDSCNRKPRSSPSRTRTCVRVCNDNYAGPYHCLKPDEGVSSAAT